MRNQTAGVIGAVGIGLVVAACSSGSSTTAASPAASSPASSPASSKVATTPATPRASGTATVSLAAVSGIPGKALVGSDGHVLYLFEADKNGTSACAGACAGAWPPVTVTGVPKAGNGVSQALLGTIKRPDGKVQLIYHDHPLYFYTADTAAGTAQGQAVKAFGAEWYVVNASGSKIDTS
jgi:predicted lipoprotein with Yx(FWY)xxD motif